MAGKPDATEPQNGDTDRHGIPAEKWGDEPRNYSEAERAKLHGADTIRARERYLDQLKAKILKQRGG